MLVRKKPIAVEAVQYSANKGFLENADWIENAIREGILIRNLNTSNAECRWMVDTLEGSMRIGNGDWLIKGVDGELYPCKDEIFRKTYEIVTQREDLA